MKKKIIALALCLALIAGIVCVFTACGDSKVDTAKESIQNMVDGVNKGDETATMIKDVDYVKANGKMVVGITEYAPMNFKDADFDKAAEVNSNTQLYKQAGNSIVCNVLVAILGQLFEGREDKYKEILDKEKPYD